MEKEKLRINMLSSSEKVAGQGVSGAYRELVQLLKRDAKDQLIVTENLPVEADVTHFHTIDLPYYLSTFQKKRSGRRIGYVHFLPDTLEGSLKIPFFLKGIVRRYVFSFYDRMEHLVVVNPTFIEDLDGYERYKKIMDNPPENLIFPGIVEPERMRELYALADLFLLPSYNELFPMTILEAASCEAPIMLRDLDLYKVILEGNYRPTTDVEDMKEAILEYRDHPEALKELKEKAKAISKEYSEEHLLEIWLKFYREQAALGKK